MASAIRRFITAPANQVQVLLLAMGMDASGLTLTCANHLFVLDPVLSPAVNAQLIGRICRQGQVRPCYVCHLLVENSVETRMTLLRHRLASGAGGAGAGGAGAVSTTAVDSSTPGTDAARASG